jgi:hypothetical protein
VINVIHVTFIISHTMQTMHAVSAINDPSSDPAVIVDVGAVRSITLID